MREYTRFYIHGWNECKPGGINVFSYHLKDRESRGASGAFAGNYDECPPSALKRGDLVEFSPSRWDTPDYKPGEIVQAGPFRLGILEYSPYSDTYMCVAWGRWAWMHGLTYRLRRWLEGIKYRIIATARIWGLAKGWNDIDVGEPYSWRSIYAINWLIEMGRRLRKESARESH